MKKGRNQKTIIEPGSGKVGSNRSTSSRLSGESGMSVPSSQRGGSNVFGKNDKGAGDKERIEDRGRAEK